MAKQIKTVNATPIAQDDAATAAAVAEQVKTLPWRCAPCWKAGKDTQLADKKQSDPTGRLVCPECGASHWGKTGLDD